MGINIALTKGRLEKETIKILEGWDGLYRTKR